MLGTEGGTTTVAARVSILLLSAIRSPELGLIYKIDIADDRAVAIEMTLTTPNCPSAQELPTMVENAAASVPGVGEVKVNIVWDPPWDPSRMSDEARAVLNMW